MWLYFVDQHHRIRHDWFGFGNDTGLVAALMFLMLLAISNDLSLRGLGTRRWKSFQRWTYAAVMLTILHANAYQRVEARQGAYEVLLAGATLAIGTFQLAGWRRARTDRRLTTKPKTPNQIPALPRSRNAKTRGGNGLLNV